MARLAASLSYTLQMTLYMGIVVYAPALALEALTGITKETAILSIGKFFVGFFVLETDDLLQVWCVHSTQQLEG